MPDDSDASPSPDPDSSDFHDISGYDIEEAITPLVLPDPSTLPPDLSPDEALSSVQKWAGMPIGLGGMGDGGVSSTDSGRAIYDPTVKPNEYAEVGSSGLVQYGGFVRDEFLPQLQGDRGIKTLREMYDNDAVVGAVIFAIQMLMRAVNWHVDPPEAPTVEEIVQDRIAERKRLADQHRAAVMQDIMIARGTQEAGLGGTDGNPTPSTSTSPKPASKPGSGSSSPAKKSRRLTALLQKSLHLTKAASTTHGPMAPALSPPMTLPPGMANLDPSSAVDPETGVPLSQTYTPTPEEIHAEELAVMVESCHPAGTQVFTNEGYVSIEAMRPGMEVVTHEGRWLPVTETLDFTYTGPLVSLKRTGWASPLAATADHRLLAVKRPPTWYHESTRIGGGRGGAAKHDLSGFAPEWIPAGELSTGDFLLEPVPVAPQLPRDGEILWEFNPQRNNQGGKVGRQAVGNREIRASKDLCRLVGYYLAEGSRDSRSIHLAFNSNETEYHADVMRCVRSVFNVNSKVQFQEGHRGNVRVGSVIASDFFRDMVPGLAHTKQVPSWVFDLSDEMILEVVIGYIRGDGCVAYDRISAASASRLLTDGIRRLLLRLGIPASTIKPTTPKIGDGGFGLNPYPQWPIQISGGHGIRLAAMLGEPWTRDRGRNSAFIHDGYAYYPINNITVEDVVDLPVYNLEVEKDHSYLAEGVSSHNCLHDMDDSWADLISQIATLIVFGFSFHETVYKKRAGFNDDPMKSSLYDDGKIGWAAIAGRAQETVHRWEFNDAGHVIGMWQLAPPKYKLRYIPLTKALLFRTTGFKGNPQGRSCLRSAYKSWYYLKRIQEYEAIGVERDLAGLPIAYVPYEWFTPGALPSEKAALEEVKRIVRNLRRNEQEGVVFPNAYDENHNKLYELNLLASPSRRQFDTGQIITRYEQRIAMTALADFILLGHEHGGGGGVKGIGQGKIDMFTTALEAWLNSIADVFNNQAIPRLMRMNGEDPALSPKLVFEKIGKTSLADVGAIITAMAGAGADLFPDQALESWVREEVGMPAKTANNAL